MQVLTMIDASIYDDRCKYLRWSMQVLAMIDARTGNSQLAKYK